MSRFASKELRTIDLGEGEWVKIPSALSYKQVMDVQSLPTEAEMSRALLSECIKEWSIKDENGNIPELTIENIERLDVLTIEIISLELTKLIQNNQDKKK